MCMVPEPSTVTGEVTEAEKQALARGDDFRTRGSAYAFTHGTRPSTIGLVLSTSPLALLTWIGEKFRDWTDVEPPTDETLTSVSLYWLTDTYPTSIYAYRHLPGFGGPLVTQCHILPSQCPTVGCRKKLRLRLSPGFRQ
ncbi:hypothetical protein NXS19_002190 [Fusarium pseudograminearum]|nr:hypothetical protein NXS19_002190 [Fusarium pseudograminearum]